MNSTEAVERTRAVIRRQHKTIATEQTYLTYLHWLRRYMVALVQMPTVLSSEQKLERFLTDLALRKNVSASTQNQAFNAILFFYKDVLGRAPMTWMRCPSPDRSGCVARRRLRKHAACFAAVRNVAGYPTHLVTRLLYEKAS